MVFILASGESEVSLTESAGQASQAMGWMGSARGYGYDQGHEFTASPTQSLPAGRLRLPA